MILKMKLPLCYALDEIITMILNTC